MSTAVAMQPMPSSSPRRNARIAGVFYLLTIIAGISALSLRGPFGMAVGMATGAFYIAVTLFFYSIFKPVSRRLSLLAAIVSLAGIANGPASMLHVLPFRVHSLAFFGVYCLLLAYLIYRSTFLPRVLGVLMALAGAGWLTFLFPSFANGLVPYIYIPGMIGEGSLTLWLLAVGLNELRWREQAFRRSL